MEPRCFLHMFFYLQCFSGNIPHDLRAVEFLRGFSTTAVPQHRVCGKLLWGKFFWVPLKIPGEGWGDVRSCSSSWCSGSISWDGNGDWKPWKLGWFRSRKLQLTNQLGGGFKYFLFSPLPGEKIPILTNIFQMGWNHQLERLSVWGWHWLHCRIKGRILWSTLVLPAGNGAISL